MENEEKTVTAEETEKAAEARAEETQAETAETAEKAEADADAEESKLAAENESLKKQLDEQKDKYMRTLAEYDNYRKRTTKEKRDSYSNGVTKAVTDIIPIIDTLELALAAPCSDENYKKGIENTVRKAQAALAGLNISEIEALDKPFDPNLHSRVMQEAKEGVESGIVIRVFQKGYKLGDKVIRHRTVVVSE